MKKIYLYLIVSLFVLQDVSAATRLYCPDDELSAISTVNYNEKEFLRLKKENQVLKGTVEALKQKLSLSIIKNRDIGDKEDYESKLMSFEKLINSLEQEKEAIIEKLEELEVKEIEFIETQKNLKASLLQKEVLIEKQENAIKELTDKISEVENQPTD